MAFKCENCVKRRIFVDKRIERINFLAKKSREEGLTEAEKAEQQKLRQEYLADFRNSFRRQLENTDIKYEDGETVPLTEFKKKSNLN